MKPRAHTPELAHAPVGTESSRTLVLLTGGLLVVAIGAAYANTVSAPFLYDDFPSIPDNPTIRHLWPLWGPLSPPPGGGLTVSGRPVLNLSLALNYAVGGASVTGYHVGNIAIHALAALALFGLARRTLWRMGSRMRDAALPLGLAVAGLWALHPLNTEAVTYIVQRAESLMGLWYFLTLYCFARAADSSRPNGWLAGAVAACLLGMGTKEVMVSEPLMVLLFDRTFVAGSFAAAWQARRRFYCALAATWLPLGALVLSTGGNRGGSVGIGTGVGWGDYWLTQFPAVIRYLMLSVWPHALVFDYGTFWVKNLANIMPAVCLVVALVVATVVALRRHPPVGFLAVWFFAILAPTSIMPGTTQMIVEHRMYLALAVVLALLVTGAYTFAGRWVFVGVGAAAIGLGATTFHRNTDYRSALAIWQDTVAKRPQNATAHAGLGAALTAEERSAEAIAEFEEALKLQPDNYTVHTNLGEALSLAGRYDEALQHLHTALHLRPDFPQAHVNLGTTFDRLGRTADAIAQYEAALRLAPRSREAHSNLGAARLRMGDTAAALAELETALRIAPEYPDAHYHYADALARAGRLTEAQEEFARGQQLKPRDAFAIANWANTLVAIGRPADALPFYESALRLHPDFPEANYNLGNILAAAGRYDEAMRHYVEAIRLQPGYAAAYNNLANALSTLGRDAEAVPEYRSALRSRPDDAPTHNNLGLALARLGFMAEAAMEFGEAVRLAPDFEEARQNWAHARDQISAASAPR